MPDYVDIPINATAEELEAVARMGTAPEDDKLYGRKNGEWVEVISTAEQDYNPDSANAQSGKAVAEAIQSIDDKYFDISSGVISLKSKYQSSGLDNHLLPEHLVIPDSVGGETVTALANAMFKDNQRVESVTLPTSITAIPQECFRNAINLTEILNTDSITSIENNAFDSCGIIEVSFPNLTTLGSYAFNKAGHLQKINIGKVTSISSHCFEFCGNLTHLIHDSNFPITSVEEAAFFNTISLKHADLISNSLSNIGAYAFKVCALNYDWATFFANNSPTVGKQATPYQMNPSAGSKLYNIKTTSSRLPAPLRIDQWNPEWRDDDLNEITKYNGACMYLSVMNAYCGIKGLEYKTVYPLADINRAIPITVESVSTMPTAAYENYGVILKYIGSTSGDFVANHYYRCRRYKSPARYGWADLGTDEPTNLDMYIDNISSSAYTDFVNNLGLNIELKPQYAENFADMIEQLQKGNYIILNVAETYNKDFQHAILIFGVNSNGEVYYVNTSLDGHEGLGDYTAGVGCALLQNIMLEGVWAKNDYQSAPTFEENTFYSAVGENYILLTEEPQNWATNYNDYYNCTHLRYQVISEGETKTLLNQTIVNTVGNINDILEGML